MTITDRWNDILSQVERTCDRVKRSPSSVRIIAVTKTQPIEKIREAYAAGARIFGENYVQEALAKIGAIKAEWHFIGALQSNKTKRVVEHFSLIHSLDRWSLAEALEKARKSLGIPVHALIEVNVAGEKSKSGVAPSEIRPLLDQISEKTQIEVVGLMTFPPLAENPEDSRHYFAETRQLAEKIATWKIPRVEMKELSMGVTSDFEVAIEEGATLVRIGAAIFGPRTVIE